MSVIWLMLIGASETAISRSSRPFGLAAVDRLGRERDAFLQILGLAGDHQGRRRIEQRDIAKRALLALEHVAQRRRIRLGIAAAQRLRLGALQTDILRLISKVRTSPFSSAATLVGPEVVISSSPSEPCTTQTRSEPRFFSTCASGSTHWLREHADHLPLDAGRVGERPEQIEDRARAELDARRADMLHRRMMRGREHEADAGLRDAAA